MSLHVRVLRLQEQLNGPSQEQNQGEDGSADGAESGASGRDIFEAATEGVRELARRRNAEQARELLGELTGPHGEFSLTEGVGLQPRVDGDLHVSLLREDRRYFSVIAQPEVGSVGIESILDETVSVEDLPEDGRRAGEFVREQTERIDRIVETERRVRSELRTLPDRPEVSQLLEARNLRPTRIVEDDFVLRRGIAREGGAIIVRIAADAEDGTYEVDGETVDMEEANLERAVADAIRGYDPQAEIEKVRDELERRLSRLLDDEGFRAFLEARELDVAEPADTETPENASRRRAYELVSSKAENATVEGYFVLDVESGAIELVDAEEEGSWTIDRVAVTHGMDRPESGGEHPGVLLLGTHQNLTDSIMYVRPSDDRVSVISIPRDIYHEGRKLNEINAIAGPEATAQVVEDLIGLEIDHYVAADFEAFRQVVDALESVPVELDREFLDPTFRYRVDGEKRMLYFSRGEHDLNGSAALALARSRKTSSDFSRSRRQQLLIAGIRERIDQLALTDADRLFDLLRVSVEHTETDMGFLEALQYYRRYRDVENLRSIVLSTDNVFRSTYAELYENDLPLERAEEMNEAELGAWILRPKGESWEGVQAFVGTWLAGGDPRPDDFFEEEEQSLGVAIEPASAFDIELSPLDEITSDEQP
ncbi:MAG: LCP family protein [Spirochaetaceae bacterium]